MPQWTFDPAVPPDTNEAARLGASRIRAIEVNLLKLLGFDGLAAQIITQSLFSVSPTGVLTITQPGAAVSADPTTPLGLATKQYADGRIAGRPAAATAPTNDQFYRWSTALSMWVPSTLDLTLTGDVTGPISANTVGKFTLVADGNANVHKIIGLVDAIASGEAVHRGQFLLGGTTEGNLTIPVIGTTIVVNWGKVAPALIGANLAVLAPVTFSKPFVTALFALAGTLSPEIGPFGEGIGTHVLDGTLTATGMTVNVNNSQNTAQTVGASWIAIGTV